MNEEVIIKCDKCGHNIQYNDVFHAWQHCEGDPDGTECFVEGCDCHTPIPPIEFLREYGEWCIKKGIMGRGKTYIYINYDYVNKFLYGDDKNEKKK